jgi:hypothetical protein
MDRILVVALMAFCLFPLVAAANHMDRERQQQISAMLSEARNGPAIHFICSARTEACDDDRD